MTCTDKVFGTRPFTRDDLLGFHLLLASSDRLIPTVLGTDRHTAA